MTSLSGVDVLRLHGLGLSYFTGKLEAYFRCKGVAYTFVEMDTADFRRCAKATGIAQMPQVERADGSWLTDTSAIIAQYESEQPSPSLRPVSAAARFISLLLEDFFDEWLWRPALYYRWAFDDDARLMSAQLARTMLRDVPAPSWFRRRLILARQRRVYLSGDGVTSANRAAIEALYVSVIEALEPVLATRPFLLGQRPCEADFGLFGPFFRHFSSDPTPAAILREKGANILAWTARLWASTPASLAAAPQIAAAPVDLDAIFRIVTGDYLPYLAANARALSHGERRVRLSANGAAFEVPANPYRGHCLAALQRAFQDLDEVEAAAVALAMGEKPEVLCELPQTLAVASQHKRPLDRQWSPRWPAI
jgi:glutathione S-transferase